MPNTTPRKLLQRQLAPRYRSPSPSKMKGGRQYSPQNPQALQSTNPMPPPLPKLLDQQQGQQRRCNVKTAGSPSPPLPPTSREFIIPLN